MRSVPLVLALALASTSVAEARPRPARSTSNFQANKKFGLGLELGSPSGLTGKYFLSPSSALDFGIGVFGYYGFRDRGGSGLHIYMDYLYHPLSLVSAEAFELPLYVGIGGRFWNYDYDRNNSDSAIGLRVPVGIAFDFNNVPLDIFFQLTFTLDFYSRYGRGTYADFEPSFGIRYYFN